MTIDILGTDYIAASEEFLSGQEGGLLYYSNRYRTFLQSLLGCRDETLVAKHEGKVVGMLPLMRRTGVYGDVINSLPFYGSNGGILAQNPQIGNDLLRVYNDLVNAENVASATIIGNPLQPGDCQAVRHNLLDQRIGQFTPLAAATASQESLLASFESSTRRNIRKALKSGVKIEIITEHFDFLETTHRENMGGIGGKTKPARFFELVPQMFRAGKDYNLYIATIDGLPVAALLLFYYNRVVEYYVPVIVEKYRTYQPLALIVYQAMLDAAKRGYNLWNWGGTWTSQDGVYNFKKKWGTVDYPYQYYIQMNDNRILMSTKEELLTEYEDFYVIPFNQLVDINCTYSGPSVSKGVSNDTIC